MTIWFDHVYTLSKENDETWIPVEKKKRLSILAWLDLIRPRIVVIQIRGYQSDALPCVVEGYKMQKANDVKAANQRGMSSTPRLSSSGHQAPP